MSLKDKPSCKLGSYFHPHDALLMLQSFFSPLSFMRRNQTETQCQRERYWARFIRLAIPEFMTTPPSG